jgi:hypothetical protein
VVIGKSRNVVIFVSRMMKEDGAMRKPQRNFKLPLATGRFSIRGAPIILCLSLAFLFAAGAVSSWAHFPAADTNATTPVLVELFTSEGCSSCPPADALLAKMDALQPIRGAQLIVLSEHVDYWNQDGWTDPFSSASITDRQNEYVRVLRLNSPYTPQFLVDGTEELQTRNNQLVVEGLQKAASVPKIPMRITSASVDPGNPAIIHGHVESDVSSEKHKADVYIAIALDHAESQVSRGENNGRHLTHVAVVTEFTRVGKLEPGKSLSQDFRVKLKLPNPAPSNLRIVAFAQESGPGKVVGVTLKNVAVNQTLSRTHAAKSALPI